MLKAAVHCQLLPSVQGNISLFCTNTNANTIANTNVNTNVNAKLLSALQSLVPDLQMSTSKK